MSARWQVYLVWTALAIVLSSGPAANSARAQCSHGGGFNPGMSQGLIAQQLRQQQQLLQQIQQQQLLQFQQQQLQTARFEQQMRDLAKEGPEAVKTALKDSNPEKRLIAVVTVDKFRLPLTDDLIERLTDDNALIRQAARRVLVGLSKMRDGKPTKGRSVDFGPVVNANRKAQETAARKWRDWFERQKNKDDLKAVASKPAKRPVARAKDEPLAPVVLDHKSRP